MAGRRHSTARTEPQAGQGCWSWYGCRADCTVKLHLKLAGGQTPLWSYQLSKQIKSWKFVLTRRYWLKKCAKSTCLDTKHKLLSCYPWLRGLHMGNSVKLGYLEAVLAVVLASSFPNKLSCQDRGGIEDYFSWQLSSCHLFPPLPSCHLFAWPVSRALNITPQSIPEPLWHLLLLLAVCTFYAPRIHLTTHLLSLP